MDQEEVPTYSELTRRLGFEYNGMVLHEYYFANLKSDELEGVTEVTEVEGGNGWFD